jgi:hypothetical protein
MPLPIPNLDDRRFDDLVAEAIARIEASTPEWSNVAPGDPGAAIVDLFAWLAEAIIYRQNLIPLRQRRAFLNLLSIPLRAAAPASGLVCVDATQLSLPDPYSAGGAVFKVGATTFTSTTDLQPTPLRLTPLIKANPGFDDATLAKAKALLRTLYNVDAPTPFVAQPAFGADGALRLSNALDGKVWIALALVKGLKGNNVGDVRQALAGLAAKNLSLALGLAPLADIPGVEAFDQATDLPPRTLSFAIVSTDGGSGVVSMPLEIRADTSNGGRKAGVALLRLPSDSNLFAPPVVADPMFSGRGDFPPELPADVDPTTLVCWITLSPPDPASFTLGYLDVNAVAVVAQANAANEVLGQGTGESDLSFSLTGSPVDPSSLTLQVWPPAPTPTPTTWMQIDNFGRAGRNDAVYVLDPSAGVVTFGDGVRGSRPPAGATIVAQSYKYGGGADGNLPAGSIKAVAPSGSVAVRQEWPTSGGRDGESVAEAERRIPAYLANRDRAVTHDDFETLALASPGVDLARATVALGLMPGATPDATRLKAPGVISVFVFTRAEPAFGDGPMATLSQLKDVFAFLRQRVLIGTQLFVLSAEPVPIYVSVSVRTANAADILAVQNAVKGALLSYLWAAPPGGPDAAGWPLGRTVPSDELRTQAGRVAGVLAADDLALFYRVPGSSDWTPAPILPSPGSPRPAVALKEWQVPALQGVSIVTDGSAAPAPPPAAAPAGAPGPTLVPIVPKVC